MAKLTNTQLIVLSKAAAREDGAATVPDGLSRSLVRFESQPSSFAAAIVTRYPSMTGSKA